MNKKFGEVIDKKARLKLKARSHPSAGIWMGLGMMGLVGWSVIIPTLLGAALGTWLDHHYASSHSWTLTLLILGLILGCFNAWFWVKKEEMEIQEDNNHE
jgi:ATP synthase protein I